MYRFIIFLVVFCIIHAKADIYDKKSFRLASSKYKVVKSHTDALGNISLAFFRKRQLELKIISSDYFLTLNKTINLSELSKNSELIATNLTENKIFAYFFDANSGVLSFCSLNRAIDTDAPQYHEMAFFERDEQYLISFVSQGKLRILSIRSNGNLILRNVLGNEVSKHEYENRCKDLKKILQKNNNTYEETLNPYGIAYIDFNRDYSLKEASANSKIYQQGKKIVLAIDDAGSTRIISLDLLTKQCVYKKYNYALEKCNLTQHFGGNSILYKENLYRITACSDMLNLSVISLDSNVLVQKFNIISGEQITFKNGNIILETDDERDKNDLDVIENSQRFLKKLDNTNLSISVHKLKTGQILMFLGGTQTSTYTQNNTIGMPNYGFGSGLSMGIGFGTGFGSGLGAPVFPASTSTYKRTRNIYFKSLIDENTLLHNEGSTPNSYNEQLKAYLEQNVTQGNEEINTITANDGKIIYGYLSGKDDLYHLIEIKK